MVRAPACHAGGRGFEPLLSRHYGSLAQLGEHLPYKQGVTGSSPVGPIFIAINYGEVAQLARAHGSYPWCQQFESALRYYRALGIDIPKVFLL